MTPAERVAKDMRVPVGCRSQSTARLLPAACTLVKTYITHRNQSHTDLVTWNVKDCPEIVVMWNL